MADDREPSREEAARELAEELRKLRVQDVLVQTLVTVSSIGFRCLGLTEETTEDRDLEQTRLAIATMQALTPVLEQVVPAELVRDFRSAVANLQLAYVKAASAAAPAEATEGGEAAGGGEEKKEGEQKLDGDG